MDEPNFNLKDLEKKGIIRALDYNNGNRGKSAKCLGISIRCLRYKLTSWDMKDYLK